MSVLPSEYGDRSVAAHLAIAERFDDLGVLAAEAIAANPEMAPVDVIKSFRDDTRNHPQWRRYDSVTTPKRWLDLAGGVTAIPDREQRLRLSERAQRTLAKARPEVREEALKQLSSMSGPFSPAAVRSLVNRVERAWSLANESVEQRAERAAQEVREQQERRDDAAVRLVGRINRGVESLTDAFFTVSPETREVVRDGLVAARMQADWSLEQMDAVLGERVT